MSDNPAADKPQSPAGNQQPGQTAPAGDNQNQPDFGAEIEKRLNPWVERVDKLEKTLLNQRQMFNKRDGELNELRRFRENVMSQARGGYIDPGQFEPPDQGNPQNPAPQAATGRDEAFEMMRWKVDNPGWQETWPEVQKILNDPMEARNHVQVDPSGNADVYASLNNIRNHLVRVKERGEMEELRKKNEELQKQIQNREFQGSRASLNDMAVISGTTAAEISEGVTQDDLDKMSYEEMEKRGLVPIDHTNPPSFVKGKR